MGVGGLRCNAISVLSIQVYFIVTSNIIIIKSISTTAMFLYFLRIRKLVGLCKLAITIPVFSVYIALPNPFQISSGKSKKEIETEFLYIISYVLYILNNSWYSCFALALLSTSYAWLVIARPNT